MIVFLVAAPLFFVGAYFVKDPRVKPAFLILGTMCLLWWLVSLRT